MTTKRLELRWPGKDSPTKLEPRILLEDAELGRGAVNRGANLSDSNLLIHGDNLLALRALEASHADQVKCVFIDPPYNTGSAFEHYEDGIEHSLWLSLIKPRVEILHRLLTQDGSIWVTIDDAEGHYLKVLMDEVFGRHNFLGTISWQKTTSVHNNATWFSSMTDMMLVYAKNRDSFQMGRIPRSARNLKDYSNPDNDPRGPWTSSPLHVSLTSGQRGKQFAKTGTSSGLFPITNRHGEDVMPPKGRCWAYSEERIKELDTQGLIWWGKTGHNQPRLKRYLADQQGGVVPTTLWLSESAGSNQEAKAENARLLPDLKDLFSTPKPERLLFNVLTLATNPGDIVLDSFAGSGTTGAVAHKMDRRWVMVELGDHCLTHTHPRMERVIRGLDNGALGQELEFKGGGGFRYFRLAPSLLKKDSFGNWVINPEYNPEMLAEAVCKLEGFTYAPSQDHFWLHGHSTEDDYIYITTQHLGDTELKRLEEELPEDKHLLVCCKAFRSKDVDNYERLRVKKIPKMVLHRCEWDRDDYSLNVPEPTKELAEKKAQPTLEAYQ